MTQNKQRETTTARLLLPESLRELIRAEVSLALAPSVKAKSEVLASINETTDSFLDWLEDFVGDEIRKRTS